MQVYFYVPRYAEKNLRSKSPLSQVNCRDTESLSVIRVVHEGVQDVHPMRKYYSSRVKLSMSTSENATGKYRPSALCREQDVEMWRQCNFSQRNTSY